MALDLTDLTAGYGGAQVLNGVTLRAPAGEVTCIMGRNGAGKSTLMKCIMGLVVATGGGIMLDGVPIHKLAAHEVPRAGIAYVPQGRRLFGPLTVDENLTIGGLIKGNRADLRDRVLTLFPRLRERLGQVSSTLSGGEQQMLAIARALCLEPKVLLLDEPTEGLQPSMITLIREAVLALRGQGVAVVLVEQRVDAVLATADQVAFMVQGRIAEIARAGDLTAASAPFRQYVGV